MRFLFLFIIVVGACNSIYVTTETSCWHSTMQDLGKYNIIWYNGAANPLGVQKKNPYSYSNVGEPGIHI